MTVTGKLITIGRGQLSSATVIGDTGHFVLKNEGRLTLKKLDIRTLRVYGAQIVGYADECWFVPGGRIERLGEEVIYAENG